MVGANAPQEARPMKISINKVAAGKGGLRDGWDGRNDSSDATHQTRSDKTTFCGVG
jgi:hypothetical protein